MYAGHNCTNYVAYRLIQSGMPDVRPWEGSGNASNWGTAMAAITDQVPTVGSIAWYKPNVTPAGSSGHVAYVEQVISETEIIVSEDYWGGDFYWRRITKTGGGWPSGFIHFNDRVVQPTSPPTIAGSPMVGAPLEVAAGAWTPAPTSITYRWLADGAEIPGATGPSYVPTPDVKGKALARRRSPPPPSHPGPSRRPSRRRSRAPRRSARPSRSPRRRGRPSPPRPRPSGTPTVLRWPGRPGPR
jgi:surface antigen